MELLYLYIEEFKSIQQQEFLLTPDFDISYKSKKLEINRKESLGNYTKTDEYNNRPLAKMTYDLAKELKIVS